MFILSLKVNSTVNDILYIKNQESTV